MKIRLAAIILIQLGVAVAQSGQEQPARTLLDRARNGDNSAISEMEEKNDLEGLHALMRDPHYPGKSQVRLALAKLGDRNSLQFLACESLTDVGGSTSFMHGTLNYVGGEFAVQAYK